MSEIDPSHGLIFDIKRFSTHDGPGIRTTVFFKGCSLRCVWCHNPEGISPEPELMVYPQKCIGCGACIDTCPREAYKITTDGHKVYDRKRCISCGQCVESCYAEALVMAGTRLSVEDIIATVKQDTKYYELSGGGITLSGGDPLGQAHFASVLLQNCQSEGIHTAVDTCGYVHWEAIRQVLPYADMFLYDLKHISSVQHRRFTGASNKLVLENLQRLSNLDIPIEIRMLIIPTRNDSRDAIEGSARLLASLRNVKAVRLLAYHRLAGSKYTSLGKENRMPEVATPTHECLQRIAGWISHYGLEVILPTPTGNSTPTTREL